MSGDPRGTSAALDMKAVEARLLRRQQEWDKYGAGNPSFAADDDCTVLLVHVRALRAALAPFVVNVGDKDGTPAIVREKGNAWFELCHPTWEDFERAAAVLAAAQDRESP